jgi:nucleotide-binding universal stress UspA family protein
LLIVRNETIFEQAELDAREFVERRAKEPEVRGGKVNDAHLASGRPDAEIVKLGEEVETGLVVVGNRGSGEVRRALLGSASDSMVVGHAHGPVLVGWSGDGHPDKADGSTGRLERSREQ